ncbi:hypothetical protein [Nocardia jejuensis]|uniref:hypothetical protein n=1 Tax=Nocardia jejuensis TaxID=328049 RepID=UPI000832F9A9|nr:hypothetical protein [Nocardia jejuensis]
MYLRIEDDKLYHPFAVVPPGEFTEALENCSRARYFTPEHWKAVAEVQRKLDNGEPVTRADTTPAGIDVRYLSDAEGIAERARYFFRDRAEYETAAMASPVPGDTWPGHRRFIDSVRSGQAIVCGPNEIHAFIPATASHVLGPALEYAAQHIPADTPLIRSIPAGQPMPGTDLHAAVLTW